MFPRSGRETSTWGGLGAALAALWFGELNGWRPLALLLAAAAVHEGGHWIALRAFHVPVTALRLTPFGMEMRTLNSRLSYPRELAAVAAGPIANLLCGWALLRLSGGSREAAAGAHFALALFNLLPVSTLDGGRILELLCAWMLPPGWGDRAAGTAENLAGIAAAGALLRTVWLTGGNLWLLPPAAYLLCPALRSLPWMGKRKNSLASC